MNIKKFVIKYKNRLEIRNHDNYYDYDI
jgi:hypothetical protein